MGNAVPLIVILAFIFAGISLYLFTINESKKYKYIGRFNMVVCEKGVSVSHGCSYAYLYYFVTLKHQGIEIILRVSNRVYSLCEDGKTFPLKVLLYQNNKKDYDGIAINKTVVGELIKYKEASNKEELIYMRRAKEGNSYMYSTLLVLIITYVSAIVLGRVLK